MRELFLASFGGRQYGIWKDAILSVRDLHALHRIPLSPAGIAGIMIDAGRTVTLADLSVCIGYGPSAETGQGCILLMAEGEKTAGFVVSGELRTLSIPPELLFSLPDYLKMPVFDTCAVHDGISIPIINIAALDSRVLKFGDEHEIRPGIPAVEPRDFSGSEKIRFFSAAGERYAVSAEDLEEKVFKPGPITPLPRTPDHVKGVTFRDGRLMPVIDLTQRIKRHSGATESQMLIASVAGAAFGFLVDRDEGTSPADTVTIKPLPLIARTSWLRNMAVRAGELIPLIDLAMVLYPASGVAYDKAVQQGYSSGSAFPGIFFKHEAEVVEFSLLGVCYALPKVEVEDVVGIKSCRALPDVPPIVIGVAEHNEEILPVVDLAMMFGRRSITAPGWRMMLVNNGDFRALVVTETVFGERRLALDKHRAVPIHLPHNLMYGCYPDQNEVRIILNVESIAVHFEKSLIQKFMPALSHEMRMSPTGVVYAFPDEKAGPEKKINEQPRPSANVTPVHAEAEPLAEVAPAAELTPEAPEFEQQMEETVAEFIEWEDEYTEAPIIAAEEEPIDIFRNTAPSETTQESLATADEWSAGAAFEQQHIQEVPDRTIGPDTATPAAETPEHTVPVEAVSNREPSGQGSKTREPAAMRKISPLKVLKASTKRKRANKISATATADSRPSEPFATASAASGERYHLNREVEPLAAWSVYEERAAGRAWKRRIAYGAIVVVLIAVYYFSWTSDKPVVEKSANGTAPVKIEQAMVQPQQSRAETVPVKTEAELTQEKAEQAEAKAQAGRESKEQAEIEARAKQKVKGKVKQTLVLSPLTEEHTEPPRPAEKSPAPLELDIPANRPVDIDEYVVQEGDTLWSISERFTGSPYNYPRIAGENRIAEPDLIFPGQRIRLIK